MPLRRNQRRGWEVLDPDTITGKVVAVALLLAVIVVADYAILLLISPPLESWETAHHITLSVISGCSIIPSFFLCSFNALECMADWSPPLLSPSRSTRQRSGRKYAHVMKHGCRAGK